MGLMLGFVLGYGVGLFIDNWDRKFRGYVPYRLFWQSMSIENTDTTRLMMLYERIKSSEDVLIFKFIIQ